jgi:tetratricopeptide (TPR) repeat protein
LYYICDHTGTKQGTPVSREQLQELADQGKINPQTRLEATTGHQGLARQLGISFPPPPIPSLTKEQLELMARNAEERYYAQARIIEDKEKELSKEISFSFSLGNEEDIDEGNHCRNIGDFFKVFVVQCLWFPFCFGCGTLITMLIIGLVLEFILPWTKYITGFVLVLAVGAAILVPIIAFIYRTYNMLIRVPAAIKQAEEQQASIRSERSGICVLLGDSCVSQRNLMGESHVSQSDLEKALEWYEKAVKLGNTNVQRKIADTKIKLGEHYCERGDSCVSSQDGGGKNYLEAALEWYEKASEMGNTDAQCKVETVKVEVGKNRCGMGDVFVLKGDFVQALEWYEKASEMGNTEALRKIDNNPGIQHAIQYEKSKSERERIERDIEKLREMGNESREWLNRRFR